MKNLKNKWQAIKLLWKSDNYLLIHSKNNKYMAISDANDSTCINMCNDVIDYINAEYSIDNQLKEILE